MELCYRCGKENDASWYQEDGGDTCLECQEYLKADRNYLSQLDIKVRREEKTEN